MPSNSAATTTARDVWSRTRTELALFDVQRLVADGVGVGGDGGVVAFLGVEVDEGAVLVDNSQYGGMVSFRGRRREG